MVCTGIEHILGCDLHYLALGGVIRGSLRRHLLGLHLVQMSLVFSTQGNLKDRQ